MRRLPIAPAYDLSVLSIDFCRAGRPLADCLAQTARLAVAAERCGFKRFWVAEHQNSAAAYASLEVMIAFLASQTQSIRVGAGGVLIHAHSPLRVAEAFRLLEALYPGRIDLGVAGSIPTCEIVSALLDQAAPAEFRVVREGPVTRRRVGARYRRRLRELMGYLEDRRAVQAPPVGVRPPATWVLSSGGPSLMLAASEGLPVCVSLIHRATPVAPSTIEDYRRRFTKRRPLDAPRCAMLVSGICADSRQRARALFERRDPTLEVFATLIGTPTDWRARLDGLSAEYGVSEFVFLDLCGQPAPKLRSHALLASACGVRADASAFAARSQRRARA